MPYSHLKINIDELNDLPSPYKEMAMASGESFNGAIDGLNSQDLALKTQRLELDAIMGDTPEKKEHSKKFWHYFGIIREAGFKLNLTMLLLNASFLTWIVSKAAIWLGLTPDQAHLLMGDIVKIIHKMAL